MKKDTFIIFFWPAISSLLFFIFALYIMLEGHLHEDIYINLNYAKNIANGILLFTIVQPSPCRNL